MGQFREGGWFTLPDGTKISPAEDGWSNVKLSLQSIKPADSVPDGKVVIGTTVTIEKGIPKWQNTLADAPIPRAVSAAQGKAILVKQGLFDAVTNYINGIEDATEKALANIAFNSTTEWERNSPFLTSAIKALNISDEQLDALFLAASKIKF